MQVRRDHFPRQQRQLVMPATLPNIPRVQSLKVHGVTISNSQSATEHVNRVISSSAQSIHALRLLRSHGMTNASLHIIYRAVVVAKLTYAASAWWVFTTAADRQRLEAVIRRAKRTYLCSSDLPSLAELVDSSDDTLFNSILSNPHHVLHSTLPKQTVFSYGLGRRRHNREHLNKSSCLVQSCFFVRYVV